MLKLDRNTKHMNCKVPFQNVTLYGCRKFPLPTQGCLLEIVRGSQNFQKPRVSGLLRKGEVNNQKWNTLVTFDHTYTLIDDISVFYVNGIEQTIISVYDFQHWNLHICSYRHKTPRWLQRGSGMPTYLISIKINISNWFYNLSPKFRLKWSLYTKYNRLIVD